MQKKGKRRREMWTEEKMEVTKTQRQNNESVIRILKKRNEGRRGGRREGEQKGKDSKRKKLALTRKGRKRVTFDQSPHLRSKRGREGGRKQKERKEEREKGKRKGERKGKRKERE